ncbi:MAG: DNA-binding protein [Candidatus Andersenbacteria bacterium RIFCSPHIGHO2_02_FULL_45_11]|uniref:DNA-binding protein n=1 Tax=Candidatus Andersenbacteria bacterium RIFCSPHIGHO2_12_FULL_45_11 TaxID=1797281 RepID=A0A1G1X518_9BACT|nr:MAG: DNA-binding protein [Candidatus Andersenbacteria bacterium RIFCSPHIGHO2_01_FULL_46_36]OGY33316.1 MAG: DNA-binding protein [Candidatus Andersenbacteria bacterium RIFCSPHIGHO2_02_FULL_45_11]OGY34670.1 MAG: DNA-binding protein [Candidatus Andersenbacteria bacterium RIFCSPHIGHO2_12_FULL_45_11]
MKKIIAKGIQVYTFERNENDYISLTDIARFKDKERTEYVVQNWMRNRDTVEFLGIWEHLHNPNFKHIEFDVFKNEAGANSFSLTPKRWIESVNAVGLISKAGRYGGGTFAHKDIAFEFASWISPEFKLYLIKEFQRLKLEENKKLELGWDTKRMLTKINYRIHTDAIKENIIVPQKLSRKNANITYANEADVLNVALFGLTAKAWKDANKRKEGNMRDYADVTQLVCLANLESLNAEFIRQGLAQPDRLLTLNEIAIVQMRSLAGNKTLKKLL